MIDVQELRKWRYAEPFRPFELVLEDGRRFLIKNPWNLGWSEKSRTVAFAASLYDVDMVAFDRIQELRLPRDRSNTKSRHRRKRREE